MKNLLLSSLAAVALMAVVGCASDTSTCTTESRTYQVTSNDSKHRSSVTTTDDNWMPPPSPEPDDSSSGDVHGSGNMSGGR
jgi:hypothetical protein